MYKDILQTLNTDRRVNDSFIERLEKNGFTIEYGKFNYWDSQPYIQIGKSEIYLVETYYSNNAAGCCYRYRNELAQEIKESIAEEKRLLKKETDLINEVLPEI